MAKIIVEFYASNASQRARGWRRSLIEAIEQAILKIENKGVQLFPQNEFTVYMTFKEEA